MRREAGDGTRGADITEDVQRWLGALALRANAPSHGLLPARLRHGTRSAVSPLSSAHYSQRHHGFTPLWAL